MIANAAGCFSDRNSYGYDVGATYDAASPASMLSYEEHAFQLF